MSLLYIIIFPVIEKLYGIKNNKKVRIREYGLRLCLCIKQHITKL